MSDTECCRVRGRATLLMHAHLHDASVGKGRGMQPQPLSSRSVDDHRQVVEKHGCMAVLQRPHTAQLIAQQPGVLWRIK